MIVSAQNTARRRAAFSIGALLAAVCCIRAGEEPMLLFDLARVPPARIRQVPVPDAVPASRSHVEQRDEGLVFELNGQTYASSRWFIPISSKVAATCRLQFSVAAGNVASFTGRPNLTVVLVRRPSTMGTVVDGGEERLIRVFAANGPDDSELGSVTFSTSEGEWMLSGLRVDLAVRRKGPASLRLARLTIHFSGNLPAAAALDEQLRARPPINARLARTAGGRLRMCIDNGPLTGPIYAAGEFAGPDVYEDLRRSTGIRIFTVPINLGGDCAQVPAAPVWLYPDYLDFPAIDAAIGPAAAQGYVMLHAVLASPPAWWPGPKDTDSLPPPACDLDPLWRQYCETALKQLLAHIRSQDYAQRIIGCAVLVGRAADNRPSFRRQEHPLYQQAFRGFMRQQYGTDKALQEAWQEPEATLETARPLSPDKWQRGSIRSLVHPVAQRRRTDSTVFFNRSWALWLEHLAHTVRENTHGRWLIGLVDGPALELQQLWSNSHRLSHNALAPLLDSTLFDYAELPLGEPADADAVDACCLLADPLDRAGKMLLLRHGFHAPIASRSAAGGDDPRTVISHQRDAFCRTLRANTLPVFVAAHNPVYDHPQLRAELQHYRDLLARCDRVPLRQQAEIAWVIDPDLFRYLAPDQDQQMTAPDAYPWPTRARYAARQYYLIAQPRAVRSRLGTPVNVVFPEELDPEGYRVVLVDHVLFLDASRRQRFEACKNHGRQLIWKWADGIAGAEFLSPHQLGELSGMRVLMRPGQTRFALRAQAGLAEYTPPDSRPAGYLGWRVAPREPDRGRSLRFGPTFTVEDPDAEILARYEDGTVAMAARGTAGWRSLYSASPFLNPEILRGAAAAAGAHIYLDGNDPVTITPAFIAIRAEEKGVRVLHLPEAQALYEIFCDQEVPSAADHHLALGPGRSYLFYRGTREQWQSTNEPATESP